MWPEADLMGEGGVKISDVSARSTSGRLAKPHLDMMGTAVVHKRQP
jgi:hypothetical protein